MKRLIILLMAPFVLFLTNSIVFADDGTEALKFFKKYVNAANSYDESVLRMYAHNAKIIRQVIKPDGELVDVETDAPTYINQLRIGQKVARFRRYKNTYTNVTASKVDNGYKISAMRQPSGEKYRLRSYMIVKKQPNGEWKIIEELMQTKVQTFLKYANK